MKFTQKHHFRAGVVMRLYHYILVFIAYALYHFVIAVTITCVTTIQSMIDMVLCVTVFLFTFI